MITRIVVRGYRLFVDFELEPNAGTNIVVGDNESGKSSLLEAISLALTGRINGRWAQDELNPYWFNVAAVESYFASLNTGSPLPPPEILIELYLTNDDDSLQYLLGVHNSRQDKVPGVKMHITPNPDYAEEFADYMADQAGRRSCPRSGTAWTGDSSRTSGSPGDRRSWASPSSTPERSGPPRASTITRGRCSRTSSSPRSRRPSPWHTAAPGTSSARRRSSPSTSASRRRAHAARQAHRSAHGPVGQRLLGAEHRAAGRRRAVRDGRPGAAGGDQGGAGHEPLSRHHRLRPDRGAGESPVAHPAHQACRSHRGAGR